MITASHNPKNDNGYKVYCENGVQIIGPHDKGISASIAANLDPKRWDADSVLANPLCIDRTREMVEGYFDHIASLSQYNALNGSTDIKFVNTSMHGVGHVFVDRSFERFGFRPFIPVKEQQHPDPEFPSVRFPNPEEAGALDLAIRTAEATGATYVLAQDPDADRFSAAERKVDGTWVTFTGDQLGAIFAGRILAQYKASGKPLEKLSMVASTVSSKLIEAMAAAEGFNFTECLTGFKYIGNTALALVEKGFEVPFGYEEAIGFMIGSEIRDKDGVSAAVFFAELVALLHREGKTASSFLEELYERYGYFQTNNSYFVCDDPLVIDRIFTRVRNYDGQGSGRTPSYPKSIAGLEVTSVVDLTLGYDTTNPPTYKPSLPLSSGHMIQFRAASEGLKVVLTTRTSGTEPKIKYYLEGSGQDRDAVQGVLREVVRELGDEWMQASLNSLGRPS
jgi:phosphomannomutase